MLITATLKALHDVIQAAFGWEGYHLYLFEVGEKQYGVPDPEWNSIDPVRSEKSMRLATLIERGIRRFGYIYDFGDDWRHEVVVEAVEAADSAADYPRLLARDVLRPRMLAASGVTMSLFERSPVRTIGSIKPCCRGTAVPTIPTTSGRPRSWLRLASWPVGGPPVERPISKAIIAFANHANAR